MCMNDKFSLISFSLTSFIWWCERINKFSLTSFHCSQQYNYTADENKNNHEAPISFFDHGFRLFDERKKVAGLWSCLCFTYAQTYLFKSYHASFWTSALVKEKIDKFFFTHQQIKFATSKLVKENLLVCNRL